MIIYKYCEKEIQIFRINHQMFDGFCKANLFPFNSIFTSFAFVNFLSFYPLRWVEPGQLTVIVCDLIICFIDVQLRSNTSSCSMNFVRVLCACLSVCLSLSLCLCLCASSWAVIFTRRVSVITHSYALVHSRSLHFK